ncbi:hypothetical protein BU23DRAFT_84341 [Bimuria novae-zelandiae CBS 107.79]|uniref:Uncharacterized protein n=1 Tax=Bimuria novae-zelandiae CBS 107.79 TaxID=1447943 RepID=A0A6A5VCQ4_9PLEO|nr:hypothetical protein BU23DRAFT_84341 [Bimuria novae-zelandiae CBS 107.79]
MRLRHLSLYSLPRSRSSSKPESSIFCTQQPTEVGWSHSYSSGGSTRRLKLRSRCVAPTEQRPPQPNFRRPARQSHNRNVWDGILQAWFLEWDDWDLQWDPVLEQMALLRIGYTLDAWIVPLGHQGFFRRSVPRNPSVAMEVKPFPSLNDAKEERWCSPEVQFHPSAA